MLILVAIVVSAGQVYEMLGLGQNITWLLFLVLMMGLNRLAPSMPVEGNSVR